MHIRPGLLQHTCMWRGARVFLHCSGIALSHHARRLAAADTRKVVPPLSHNDCPDWPCHVLGFGLDSLNTETAGRPYKRKGASTLASRTQLSASTRMNLRRLYPCESPLPRPQPGVDMVCLYCDTSGGEAASIAELVAQYFSAQVGGSLGKWCKQRESMIGKQKAELVQRASHPDAVKAAQCISGEMDKTAFLESLDSLAVADLHGTMRSLRNLEKNFAVDSVKQALSRFQTSFGDALPSSLVGYERFFGTAFSEYDSDLKRVGSILPDLTATQAMVRDLDPGEVRVTLVSRVMSALARRRFHTVSATVRQRADAIVGKSTGAGGCNAASSASWAERPDSN